MYQDGNPTSFQEKKFIFSDDFYDSLDSDTNNNPNENSFVVNNVTEINIPTPVEETSVPEQPMQVEQPVSSGIEIPAFNPVSTNSSPSNEIVLPEQDYNAEVEKVEENVNNDVNIQTENNVQTNNGIKIPKVFQDFKMPIIDKSSFEQPVEEVKEEQPRKIYEFKPLPEEQKNEVQEEQPRKIYEFKPLSEEPKQEPIEGKIEETTDEIVEEKVAESEPIDNSAGMEALDKFISNFEPAPVSSNNSTQASEASNVSVPVQNNGERKIHEFKLPGATQENNVTQPRKIHEFKLPTTDNNGEPPKQEVKEEQPRKIYEFKPIPTEQEQPVKKTANKFIMDIGNDNEDEQEEVTEEPPRKIHEFKLPTTDAQQRKIHEFALGDNNKVTEVTYNTNVETGIDYDLEKELLSIDKKKEEEDYSNFKIAEEKPKEKIAYRAIRRQDNININPTIEDTVNELEKSISDEEEQEEIKEIIEEWKPPVTRTPIIITETLPVKEKPKKNVIVKKSTILEELEKKEKETGKISILARYGEDFCSYDYITNPAIGRDDEIKQLDLILITPDKSAILVGKPGIGKTSIVEGLAYKIQRDDVPNVLKGYSIISIKTTSLLGTLPNGETRLQTLIDELKDLDKIILFMDEIHMLMGATNDSGLDFANMFKESLGRGNIKMIGATTNDEYERYVLRDKAFVRRFQKVDVEEPTPEQTVEILMGTLPKLEKKSNVKLKYTHFIQVEIMRFIVNITSEYKRVYGIGSRYPDICISLLNNAFSEALFNNRDEVNINDIRQAIKTSKNIYPDVIRKELVNFDEKFSNIIEEEK